MNWKNWFKAAGIRALRTIGQVASGAIGTAVLFSDVDWKSAISISLMAGISCLLMSLSGLPEIKEEAKESEE